MSISFKYWDDCVDPNDLEAMWREPAVSTEWLDAGETRGQKVHISRDPDGEPYLTQTEMKAVADIIVRRHFDLQISPDMICAIAELASDRQLLARQYQKKTKEITVGIMQILPKTAQWLERDFGYRTYGVGENPDVLYKPFVSVYFGAAYLKWLSNFEHKERSEEFVVRAYHGGTKKATHKSTLQHWKRYLSVKESLPSRRFSNEGISGSADCTSPRPSASAAHVASPSSHGSGSPFFCGDHLYWDSRASPEDMSEMWNQPDVAREWSKSGERRGKVRFSQDKEKRPYLSRVEIKAVASIILSKHFSTRGVRPSVLCALAEMVSMRFLNGIGHRTGIMGIDYSTAFWLYTELGYRAYRVDSVDDMTKPFLSMYFGAAYMAWLSEYERRERTPQFVVQAYLAGPQNVRLQETGPLWLKFEQALGNYEDMKR
ncbi:unnamed protein product [Linum tenue]|uniref:Transglycosylase SLT domain-containing protein n=2 Tax=Linum tenue TaxID=586396 RepID=A0AAV0RG91_9ROSI|nr:unnamed protein product [Linum tenue]